METKSTPGSAPKDIPDDVIDDLCSRFIINIPPEERSDLIRVLFQIEHAHWFYIDYNCAEQKNLPKCQFKEFTRAVFKNVPFLQAHIPTVDSLIDKWREYKMAVPTYGAILLDKDMDNVLLVQGFGAKSSWGFPKGKVNADEDPVVCACREVLEETGYDCSSAMSPKDYIELNIQDTLIRLYIVTGVDGDTIFKPQTRCEIKNCTWFKISELPAARNETVTIQDKSIKSNAFFMALPFVKPLRKWIKLKKRSPAAEPSAQYIENGNVQVERVVKEIMKRPSTTPVTTPTAGAQKVAPRQAPQTPPVQQTCKLERRKLWSNTWANFKIDWAEIPMIQLNYCQ